jgi:hypothetical protein
VLVNGLLKEWRQGKGRFRSFLLTALHRFAQDQIEAETRQKRVPPGGFVPLLDDLHPDSTPSPADVFAIHWAVATLAEAGKRVREDCLAKNQEATWKVFRSRVWRPLITGDPPPSHEESAAQAGLPSPEQSRNRQLNGERQFRRGLRAVILEYVSRPEEVESELTALADVLRQAPKVVLEGLARAEELVRQDGPGKSLAPDGDGAAPCQSTAELLLGEPRKLADMLCPGTSAALQWRDEDLRDHLRMQLAAAMDVDLSSLKAHEAHSLRAVAESRGLVLKSFSDLFQHPAPPVALLKLVKDYAKANLTHPDSPIPQDVARLLYYASSAAALIRWGDGISAMSRVELRRGFEWALQRTWVDEGTKRIFSDALTHLATLEKPSP